MVAIKVGGSQTCWNVYRKQFMICRSWPNKSTHLHLLSLNTASHHITSWVLFYCCNAVFMKPFFVCFVHFSEGICQTRLYRRHRLDLSCLPWMKMVRRRKNWQTISRSRWSNWINHDVKTLCPVAGCCVFESAPLASDRLRCVAAK